MNNNENKQHKSYLQNVIRKLLLYTAGFMLFSMFMYIIGGSDKWFSRLVLAIVCAGLYALLEQKCIDNN